MRERALSVARLLRAVRRHRLRHDLLLDAPPYSSAIARGASRRDRRSRRGRPGARPLAGGRPLPSRPARVARRAGRRRGRRRRAAAGACVTGVGGVPRLEHLYLEKPLATCVEDARRVAADAADAGVTAVVGFHRRVHPTYQRARLLLGAGAIGRVRGVHTVFAEPSPAEGLPAWKRRRDSGGGVLLDLAVHHLDLLRWMLGREMAVDDCALSSTTTEHDGALLRLRAEDGIEVQGRFSFRDGPADVIEFFGSAARYASTDIDPAPIVASLAVGATEPGVIGISARSRIYAGGSRRSSARGRALVSTGVASFRDKAESARGYPGRPGRSRRRRSYRRDRCRGRGPVRVQTIG